MFKTPRPEFYSESHVPKNVRWISYIVALILLGFSFVWFKIGTMFFKDMTILAVTGFALLWAIIVLCDARREARNKRRPVSVNEELSIFEQDWKAPLGEPCVFD